MSTKKIPLRRCIVTGDMLPKKELIRIVRNKEGEVSVDTTGKKPGRGAYLSKKRECILQAQKKHALDTQLNTKIEDALYIELLEIAGDE